MSGALAAWKETAEPQGGRQQLGGGGVCLRPGHLPQFMTQKFKPPAESWGQSLPPGPSVQPFPSCKLLEHMWGSRRNHSSAQSHQRGTKLGGAGVWGAGEMGPDGVQARRGVVPVPPGAGVACPSSSMVVSVAVTGGVLILASLESEGGGRVRGGTVGAALSPSGI